MEENGPSCEEARQAAWNDVEHGALSARRLGACVMDRRLD